MVHLYGTARAAPPTSPSEPSNTPTAGPGARGLLPGHCSRADGHHEAAADDHPAPPAVRRRHPTVSPLPLSHDRSGKLDWILLLALVRVQRCSAPSWCHRSVCPRSGLRVLHRRTQVEQESRLLLCRVEPSGAESDRNGAGSGFHPRCCSVSSGCRAALIKAPPVNKSPADPQSLTGPSPWPPNPRAPV